MKIMKKTIVSMLALAVGVLISSCKSDEDKEKCLITFHLGVTSGVPGGITLENAYLPVSKRTIIIEKKPFMYSGDLVKVDLVQFEQFGGVKLDGFQFTCTDSGVKRLTQATGSTLGGIVVIKVNEKIIASRPIDSLINTADFGALSEIQGMNREELEKLYEDMNNGIKEFKDVKEKNNEVFF